MNKLNGVAITCNLIAALIKLDLLIHILFGHYLVPFKILHPCLQTSCFKVKEIRSGERVNKHNADRGEGREECCKSFRKILLDL
jgi:hypothetical protein